MAFPNPPFLRALFPSAIDHIRRRKLRRILSGSPQISRNGSIRYWGAQNYDDYEPAIYRVLGTEFAKHEVFVNVGANHGIYSIRAAEAGKSVFAFEPSFLNFQILLKNVVANNMVEKITCFFTAIGAQKAIVSLFGDGTGASLNKGWNQQTSAQGLIPVSTLDEVIADKLRGKSALFLIDVESHEFNVLRGLSAILADPATRTFVIEIPTIQFMPNQQFNPHFAEIFAFFFDRGYKAEEILANSDLKALSEAGIKQMIAARRFTGLMVKFSPSGQP